jgi:hypothetical protein
MEKYSDDRLSLKQWDANWLEQLLQERRDWQQKTLTGSSFCDSILFPRIYCVNAS